MASSILTEAEVRAVIDALKLEIPPMIRNKLEAWKGVVVEVGAGANLGSVRVARGDEPTVALDLLRNWYPVIGPVPAATDEVWALSWYGGGIVLTGGSGGGGRQLIEMPSDVTTSVNTWEDTTGLSFEAEAGVMYRMQVTLMFIVSTNLTAFAVGMSGPASPTAMANMWLRPNSTSTIAGGGNNLSTTYDSAGLDAGGSPAATPHQNIIVAHLMIQPSVAGTVQIRHRCELATSHTVKAGSTLEVW